MKLSKIVEMMEEYMDMCSSPSYKINSITFQSDYSYKFNITEYLCEPYDLYVNEDGIIFNDKECKIQTLDNMKSAYDYDKEILDEINEFEKKWRSLNGQYK